MRRVGFPLLIAYFPLLAVLVELGVAVGSNFLLVHEVGGSYIPAYISIPLSILCTVASFLVAFVFTKMVHESGQTRRTEVLTSIAAFFCILLLGVYGYFRLEFSGVILYEWDAIIDCCTPSGEVSGIYIILCSSSAVIGLIGYYAHNSINRFQRKK